MKQLPSSKRVRQQWTQKGRIIYDRKEHNWTVKDFIRVAKKVQWKTFFELEDDDVLDFFKTLSNVLREILSFLSSVLLDKLVQAGILTPFLDVLLGMAAEIAYRAAETIRDWVVERLKQLFK
jgi:hypothetical protein